MFQRADENLVGSKFFKNDLFISRPSLSQCSHEIRPDSTHHCGISQYPGLIRNDCYEAAGVVIFRAGGETHGIVGSPSMLHWGYLVTSHLIIHPKSVQLRARHPAGLEIMLAPTGLHHHGGHNVNQAMSVLRFQILLLIKHSGIWVKAGV